MRGEILYRQQPRTEEEKQSQAAIMDELKTLCMPNSSDEAKRQRHTNASTLSSNERRRDDHVKPLVP